MNLNFVHAVSTMVYTGCLATAYVFSRDDGALGGVFTPILCGFLLGYRMVRNTTDPEVQQLGEAILFECTCAAPATFLGDLLITNGLVNMKRGCVAAFAVNQLMHKTLAPYFIRTATIPDSP